ncbi:MAG TPA: T9SS type A sorting domain-containing protein [Bacteroidia bacterium]|nr:T9SS type A sorting domain-containing protein [Bacteroidia bacterium]
MGSLLVFPGKISAQMSFFQDLFNGGVTCAGYSPDYFQTSPVTGVITVNIAAGSTIRKAYLFSGRLGPAPATIVTLNGNPLTFDIPNQVTPTFNTIYGGASGVHAIDVTALVSVGTNVYNLGIPSQSSTTNRYQDYYLYITYNNAGMGQVATAIFLNSQNAATNMNFGTLTLTNPINTAGDAMYSYFGGYECSASDGENVVLNGTNLGVVFGPDINSGTCGGPVGSFYYNNNVGTALSDDNVNIGMSGPEALSKFNAITTNGATTVSLDFIHANVGAIDNHPWGSFFAYKSGAVLPIELSEFKVVCQKDKAILNWTTSTELNNDYFTVERSVNAVDFVPLATIKGSGTSNEKKYYTFTDPSPEQETNYYRLRQTDKDNSTTVSNPVFLRPCLGLAYYKPDVFPNPATTDLNINFSFIPINTNYTIINSFGDVVYKGTLDYMTNKISVTDYPTGVYSVFISDSENIFTYRFVKK